MKFSNLGCLAGVLATTAFLAWLTGTGALLSVDGVRVRLLRWVVESAIVSHLGRGGGVAAIVGGGAVLAALIVASGRRGPAAAITEVPRRLPDPPPAEDPPAPGGDLPPIAEPKSVAESAPGVGIVYVSVAATRFDSRKSITNAFQDPDYKAVIAYEHRNAAGEPMPADDFPKEAWVPRGKHPYKTLPNLFYAAGFWFVSAKAAHIMQKFDLGHGALYPVRVLGKDRETPIGNGWFCINFGNRKTAFLPDQSRLERPAVGGIFGVHSTLKDGAFAVSTDALDGPDVWVDPTLRDSMFFSERLGRALIRGKAAAAFLLRECRVVDR